MSKTIEDAISSLQVKIESLENYRTDSIQRRDDSIRDSNKLIKGVAKEIEEKREVLAILLESQKPNHT